MEDFMKKVEECINSSKVYCKLQNDLKPFFPSVGINSSKVYCKYTSHYGQHCPENCINSSKVYCK